MLGGAIGENGRIDDGKLSLSSSIQDNSHYICHMLASSPRLNLTVSSILLMYLTFQLPSTAPYLLYCATASVGILDYH